jgi:hypothetical protein
MARRDRKATGEISRRLEYVRTEFTSIRYTLADFHRVLGGRDLVSYQTVQNYHFDRDASVQYLAAVAEVFSVDLDWLATGKGTPSPWGTPGLEGEIDPATRVVLDSLTDPEERALTAEQERRLSALKFLGPLRGSVIDHGVSSFADALDERRSPEDMRMTMDDWRARNLRVIQGLDSVLATTWETALDLLRQEIALEAGDLTVDQQTRFAHGLILAVLAMLPERDIPLGTRIYADDQPDSAGVDRLSLASTLSRTR